MNNEPTKWRSKSEYYDIENGDQISEYEAKTNYIIVKHDTETYVQNGHGNIKHVYQCKRIYANSLFSDIL